MCTLSYICVLCVLQAVDLNLHLMKWRAAPALDTGLVAQTKCLLLGEAGVWVRCSSAGLATFLRFSRVFEQLPMLGGAEVGEPSGAKAAVNLANVGWVRLLVALAVDC